MPVFRRPAHAAAAGDPIPFEHDGTIHLFYLSSPAGTVDYPDRVRTSWEHLTTRDGVRWDTCPTALAPGAPGTADAGGIWTGSVVEHGGTYWLFYTAHDPAAERPQKIGLATSTDLVSFSRHPASPLLEPVPGCEPVDWRDPYVFFNADEQRWWMLIAARRAAGPIWRRGVIMLATSGDLLHWTVEPEPLYDPGTTYCPECPELWPAGGRWYLVYSQFSEDVGTVYRVADSPRGPFRTPRRDALGGRRWYAAKSAPVPGGRVFFGWLHDLYEGGGNRRWLWGGDFATPRRVAPAADGDLAVEPVWQAWSAGSDRRSIGADIGAPGVAVETELCAAVPVTGVLEAVVETRDAAVVGLDLLDVDQCGLRLSYRPATGRAELRAHPWPLDDFWADLTGRRPDVREVDGPVLDSAQLDPGTASLDVRAVLDGEVLEIYLDGQVALTWRVRRGRPLRLTYVSTDGRSSVTGTVGQRE